MADTTSARVVRHTASRQSAAPPAVLGSRGILAGVGAFIVSALIGVSIVLASMGASYESGGDGGAALIGVTVTFLIAPVAAIVMLFSPRTRPGAAGILIIFAAGWILLVGPCVVPGFVALQA